jgi:hypothetical protein
VVYCILETPAKSAAEYPHQVQQKTRILGVKSATGITSLSARNARCPVDDR